MNECGHEMYDVALPEASLLFPGTMSSYSTSSTSGTICNCPKTLAFGSSKGGKQIVSPSPYMKDMDIETLFKHNLGATLYDVLKAEENAAAIID